VRPRGLTLLEVLLALGVLAIVLLAYTGLQVTSLRAGASGRATQAMAREAENFLESLRADPASVGARCGGSVNLGPYRARCTHTPCGVGPDGAPQCPTSGTPRLYRVTLEVPGDRPRVRLETLIYAP